MKVERIASVPLVTHDPFFSVWSSADNLYDADTVHWSQLVQRMYGYITVDGTVYCFMGDKSIHPVIEQKSLEVTATATRYTFANDDVELRVSFASPLLLDDPVLVSRPCTYIDFQVQRKRAADIKIDFQVTADFVQNTPGALIGGSHKTDSYHYASMSKAKQHPLGESGDNVTIDWGTAYLASAQDEVAVVYRNEDNTLLATASLETEVSDASLIFAFDDLLSINYMGQWRKAYWTKAYDTILDAIAVSFADKDEVLARAAKLDKEIEENAAAEAGDDYALLCVVSYRHAISAHKLIEDEEGNIIYLSKENDSNGCIGTVDLSYPSMPLFLLYNTEYMKGMLRPIFKFADLPVWEYDFAPHDVGRYPYATGQVYGLNGKKEHKEFNYENGSIFPFYYQYPSGCEVYDFKYQMPVEESGNMLIMMAAISAVDGNTDFAAPHYETLEKWTEYLLEYGADPGEQLCTDDFAGHLSHNVNLSAKAIMGIEAFAQLSKQMGKEDVYEKYHHQAADMAKDWEVRAREGEHYRLSFDKPGSWSLKYNLIWDKFFDSNLFSEEVFQREIACYIEKSNAYGVPLDSRQTYTKSDWILWCAAFADDREQAEKLIAPIAAYVRESNTRIPFSDWYETISGDYCHFKARSVQGGIFMPLLIKK